MADGDGVCTCVVEGKVKEVLNDYRRAETDWIPLKPNSKTGANDQEDELTMSYMGSKLISSL